MSNANRYRLDEICDIHIGRTPSRSDPRYWGAGYPWLSIADMAQGKELTSTKEQITNFAVEECGGYRVRPGTLLMSFKLTLGKIGFARCEMYTNEAIAALPIRDLGRVYPQYLYHALSSLDLSKSSDRAVLGATLNKSKLAELQIFLPDFDEQKRIANLLDKTEHLLKKRKVAISLADTLLRAAYLELASKQKERTTIERSLANIPNAARTGPFGSQLLVSEFQDSGVPVLGIDNVVHNEFSWGARRFISEEKYKDLERYTVRPGDVIVSIMGTTGRVAIAPHNLPKCISTKHLCALTLNDSLILPEYLWACLRWDPEVHAQTQRESKGAIMEGWNMGIVKGLEIRKPPLEQQERFAKQLCSVRRLQFQTTRSLDNIQKLSASLSAQLLSQRESLELCPH